MTIRTFLAASAVLLAGAPAMAQETTQDVTLDCTLPANETLDECLAIPLVPVAATAFLPAALPIIGLGVAALVGGSGETGTPTTPTTPSTN